MANGVELPGPLRERLVWRETIGEGAFGAVHRVEDRASGTPLALKLIEVGEDARRVARELEAARKVDHPHLLKSHAVGLEGARAWILMELAEGSLEDRMGDRDAAWALLRQAARGVAALHRAGLVHRDLKPANVLIVGGQARVADLGLVRDLDAATLTATGTIMGTPTYMAPEQARGERADAAADLHALGVIAFEIVEGAPPYPEGLGMAELLARVASGKRDPLQRSRSWLPRAAHDGIEAALAADPAARPRDAAAWAEGLGTLEEGRGAEGAAEVTGRIVRAGEGARGEPTAPLDVDIPASTPSIRAPPAARGGRGAPRVVGALLVLALGAGLHAWLVDDGVRFRPGPIPVARAPDPALRDRFTRAVVEAGRHRRDLAGFLPRRHGLPWLSASTAAPSRVTLPPDLASRWLGAVNSTQQALELALREEANLVDALGTGRGGPFEDPAFQDLLLELLVWIPRALQEAGLTFGQRQMISKTLPRVGEVLAAVRGEATPILLPVLRVGIAGVLGEGPSPEDRAALLTLIRRAPSLPVTQGARQVLLLGASPGTPATCAEARERSEMAGAGILTVPATDRRRAAALRVMSGSLALEEACGAGDGREGPWLLARSGPLLDALEIDLRAAPLELSRSIQDLEEALEGAPALAASDAGQALAKRLAHLGALLAYLEDVPFRGGTSRPTLAQVEALRDFAVQAHRKAIPGDG